MKHATEISSSTTRRRQRRRTEIMTFFGNQDGIRFGTLVLLGATRGFHHDRLSGTVRLFCHDAASDCRSEDKDSSRRALAKALLDARWSEERQHVGASAA